MNGARVKQWLKERNMRPEELAVRLGVSMGTINKIFAGRPVMKPIIIALASIMGCEETELCPTPKMQKVSRKA